MSVGSIEMMINKSDAQNFPNTICQLLIGLVCKISIVPLLDSSAKHFIVIAGINNRNNHGAKEKKDLISAKPAFKILNSPLKTHKNRPFDTRKTPITK